MIIQNGTSLQMQGNLKTVFNDVCSIINGYVCAVNRAEDLPQEEKEELKHALLETTTEIIEGKHEGQIVQIINISEHLGRRSEE